MTTEEQSNLAIINAASRPQYDLEWLFEALPAREVIQRRSEADYYGASYLIATALGYETVPRSVASWKHGVSYEKDYEFPEVLLTEGNRGTRHLVANGYQVVELRRRGFRRVHAIGAPFLYVERSSAATTRVPGSLLVMPAHSLFNAKHSFDEDAYVEKLLSIRGRFGPIVACIGAACVSKGEWTGAFDKAGIPWIVGADSNDRNALRRIARIFERFEFMTTNVLGSHIAYAAYSGCKVSIWGPYAQYKLDDFRHVPWFKRNWDRLRQRGLRLAEEYVRSKHPHLFRSPWDAELLREWAEPYLGSQYKRDVSDVARLLGWSTIGQLEVALHQASRKCSDFTKALGRRGQRLWSVTAPK